MGLDFDTNNDFRPAVMVGEEINIHSPAANHEYDPFAAYRCAAIKPASANLPTELHGLAKQAECLKQTEDRKFQNEELNRQMAEADSTIKDIPAKLHAAAAKGQYSVDIMRIANWYSDQSDEKPQLNAAQQKVFDYLRDQGFKPTVVGERSYWDEAIDTYRDSWVLKANW